MVNKEIPDELFEMMQECFPNATTADVLEALEYSSSCLRHVDILTQITSMKEATNT